MKVKICGIKRIEDAKLATRFGADAIGLLVGQQYPSDDFIDEDLARNISKQCLPYVTPVLVTHLQDPRMVFKLAVYIGVYVIQLHSEFSLEAIKELKKFFEFEKRNIKLVKNIHANNDIFDKFNYFSDVVDAFIVDTADPITGKVGGTGITHDWSITTKVVKSSQLPIILAGGLTPDNIANAIDTVRPYGVDVNTGLKDSTGFKDSEKMKRFIFNARSTFFDNPY